MSWSALSVIVQVQADFETMVTVANTIQATVGCDLTLSGVCGCVDIHCNCLHT